VPIVESLNISAGRPIAAKSGISGIDKRPTAGPVGVRAPGPKGIGGSGLAGDLISDKKHHGGDDQAVYAYAREDLDWWQGEIGGLLRSGVFGENVTTLGLDVTEALIGERWRIGEDLVLEVTAPRIPCATFAVWMEQKGWLQRFTARARPGAYFRVVEPGEICAGDSIAVEFRPDHRVTIGRTFRALTLDPDLLPSLLDASEYLVEELKGRARGGGVVEKA
jgi:MOSC domain-containing protein YiiM